MPAQGEEERDPAFMKERYKDLMKDIKNSMVGVNKMPPPDLQIYLDLILNIYSVRNRKLSLHLCTQGWRVIKISSKLDLKNFFKLKECRHSAPYFGQHLSPSTS